MPVTTLFSSGTPQDPSFPLVPPAQPFNTERASFRCQPTASGDTLFTRTMFVADGSATYQVVGVTERHSIVGSVTAMIVHASGAGPIASGLPILGSTLSTFGTAETTIYGTLINSTALVQLPPGDSLGVRWGTTGATAPEGIIEVTLQRIG